MFPADFPPMFPPQNEGTIACPKCAAGVGKWCVSQRGHRMDRAHPERRIAWIKHNAAELARTTTRGR